MGGGICIRGEQAGNVSELLGPDGIGKVLLGARRVPQEELSRSVAGMISQLFPDMTVTEAEEGELPVPKKGGTVVMIPNIRSVPGIDEWISGLTDDTIVLCAQELCHQVPAVFRMR